jgi:hypothetical protein
MKKIYFSFLCCLISLFTQAQNTFAPLGAEWWYHGDFYYVGPTSGGGTMHLASVGDTTIQGIIARNLAVTTITHTYYYPNSNDNRTDTTHNELYVYNNDDTVFCYNKRLSEFTPLYIFNINEGDTVRIPSFNTLANDTNLFTYVVDSIRDVDYNSEVLKTIYTTTILDSFVSPNSYEITGEGWHTYNKLVSAYAQRIGGLRAGLLPSNILFRASYPIEGYALGWNTHFKCYKDNEINISINNVYPNLTCDYMPLSVNDLVSVVDAITIYPNPAQHYINIQRTGTHKAAIAIQIINTLGQVVAIKSMPADTDVLRIDTQQWSPGIYQVILIQEGNRSSTKMVIY